MKTLIVDDERLARNELKRLLADHEAIDVMGEAANADEAEAAIAELDPTSCSDVQMPGGSGFDWSASTPCRSSSSPPPTTSTPCRPSR